MDAIKRYARHKVSQDKRRFQESGFDLDLTYITPRIIAMVVHTSLSLASLCVFTLQGFPTDPNTFEASYRNPRPEVQNVKGGLHQIYDHSDGAFTVLLRVLG